MTEASRSESARTSGARSRAERRLRRERDTLRPLGLAVIVAVVVTAAGGHPAPGWHGRALGVTLALCAFALTFAPTVGRRLAESAPGLQAAAIAVTGGAGVALSALQPRGATALAGGVAVWMAVARLPPRLAVPLAGAIAVGLVVATGLAGDPASAVLANALLYALLALVAYFMQQARASQARTELLLAELEDAREQQLQAAAIAERGRIASELHDVLAHSLSGAAIQLQGARKLAERDGASPQIRAAVDRAAGLVRDGLTSARQAVGALRGEELPGVAQLASLVESFRTDMHVDASLTIEGSARTLTAEASLALYRGAQEALTNVARYAPGAAAAVTLRYRSDRTTLTVENRLSAPAGPALPGVGGGRGLSGMRERLERAGGTMSAGPTEPGWRVELEVPE